jgi:uncharacterized membrane protein
MKAPARTAFPLSPGVWLGLGLGGFFDGIVLHQVLQWHHMLTSAGFPATSLHNLEFNTLWDGVFHMATWVFVVVGLALLWRHARRGSTGFAGRRFIGSMLIGWGGFNLVEGIVDHHLLGLHHVNETVARSAWIWWDLGFLAWGAAMLAGGYWLCRARPGASRA